MFRNVGKLCGVFIPTRTPNMVALSWLWFSKQPLENEMCLHKYETLYWSGASRSMERGAETEKLLLQLLLYTVNPASVAPPRPLCTSISFIFAS